MKLRVKYDEEHIEIAKASFNIFMGLCGRFKGLNKDSNLNYNNIFGDFK